MVFKKSVWYHYFILVIFTSEIKNESAISCDIIIISFNLFMAQLYTQMYRLIGSFGLLRHKHNFFIETTPVSIRFRTLCT